MNLWPHQSRAISSVYDALDAGTRRICLQSPTGGGKTLCVQVIAQAVLERGCQVALYSNRRFLIDQLSERLTEAGLYHGIRAAGEDEDPDCRLQICSMATEVSRVSKRGWRDIHAGSPGDLAIIDEGHLHTGPEACKIRQRHIDGGAATLDVTATPFDLADVCDLLIQAGTMSELRECGALVPAHHFGPDEPDFAAWKKQKAAYARMQARLNSGEGLSERDASAVIMVPGIFGRVWEWFNRLNPDRGPTILFGPDVKGSLWFAEQFAAKGIKAAHIDGQDVWIDGELHRTSPDLRREVLRLSEAGEITVICNRYVMREGIDCPWLRHGIFATVFGLQSYIQSGGRLLRKAPGKDSVTIQDHGGNWWRHGSLNVDRVWQLELTQAMASGLRADRIRQRKEREPIRCPECGEIVSRDRCVCGYDFRGKKISRPVVSTDGQLRELTGNIFKPRAVMKSEAGPELWRKMYWRSRTKKGARTFAAAFALFAYENQWQWPSREWPFMPLEDLDVFRLVADVPMERLRQQEAIAHS